MRLVPFTLGFRSPRKRARHFADHAIDFGVTTEADYEQMADIFLGEALQPHTYERIRTNNGDIVRYNSVTEEYGVLSSDNYIRTYFKPDVLQHGLANNYDYYLTD